MPLPLLGIHLRIRLDVADEQYYRSRLLESTESHYYIEVPLHYRTQDPFPHESHSFWVEFSAQDGSVCRFSAKRLRLINTPTLAWEIAKPNPKDVKRQQRREFVRVQVGLPVRLAVFQRADAPIDCYSRDISGGGMAFVVPKSFVIRSGLVLEAKFTLTHMNFPVNAKCFVIRVSDVNENGFKVASTQFIDMSEAIRQRIIQFTFTRQRLNT